MSPSDPFCTGASNHGRAVCIAGGGIGGLTAALAFACSGADVTVLERAAAIGDVGGGIQITPNGARVLSALGLDGALDAVSIRAQAVCPMDALTGRQVARFDLGRRDGVPYRFIARADLIGVLAAACDAAGVTLRTGVRAELAGLPDADLCLGADGLHSVLRSALNGPDAPFFTGQVAWRAVVAVRADPVARIWMAPGRHVVTYPLPDGRTNVVAVQERAAWADEGWHVADDPAHLRAAFADTCDDLRAVLDPVAQVRLWGLFRHPVAARWQGTAAGRRVALLGDAAHPTLPFLAQGANLAIEDAGTLARLCASDGPLDAALQDYQARRAPRVSRAIRAANANAVNYHLSGLRRRGAYLALTALSRTAPGAFLSRLDWLYGFDATRG